MPWDQNLQREDLLGVSAAALRAWLVMSICAILWLVPDSAQAQTLNQYTNSSSSAIADNNCSAAGSVTRTFNVGSSYIVGDVDLGVRIAHTYRSDIRVTLISPSGTSVNVLTWSGNVQSGDNYNDLFDDEAASAIISHNATVTDPTSNPGTSYPYYSHAFRPSNPLSAFDGENAAGTWTMTICDAVGADTGTFNRADLYITEPPPSADLSLTKTFGATSSNTGIYTLSVTNASSSVLTATGVTVGDTLPAGVTLTGTSGTGSFSGGIWTLGTSIAPGQTFSINLNVNITATSGTITNIAQIRTSSAFDFDSTPNNGITTEDDYASVSFTAGGRLPGYAPPLSGVCPIANHRLFSWASPATWNPSGSLIQSYPVTDIGSISFAVTAPPVGLQNSTPEITTDNSGGGATGTRALYFFMNNGNENHTSSTTLTLPTAVPGLQFTIFDIDYAANQFTDMVTVTGTYNGATVLPTLSNNTANYVSGNSVIGDGASGATEAFGNVVVTFTSPVDSVTVVYGNYLPTTPTSSGNQAMSIHDFTFCKPTTTLSVTKISSVVSDPVNGTTNPKAIPGATMRYCILMSNSGSATATSITATDNIPADVTYVPGSMRSGAGCGSATTVEDDNAVDDLAGAPNDESDPFGASIAGTILTATATTLGPAATFALTFQAIVD